MNEYGLDVNYFSEKLNLILRDASRYTPAEITYVTNYEQKPEFVVFGIKNPELVTKPQSEVEERHA